MASSPMCAHRLRYFVISAVRAALISFAALGILLNFLYRIDFFDKTIVFSSRMQYNE